MSVTRHPWRALAAAAALVLLAARAEAAPTPADLDKRYPKDSIATAADAQRALQDVSAATQALDRALEAERVRCAGVFLATPCLDEARRTHARGSAQIRRVEVEAHDLLRRNAAVERQARREAGAAAERPAAPGGAAGAGPAASVPGHGAARNAPAPAIDPARQHAQELASREHYEQRQAQHEREEKHRVDIQIRDGADNSRRFQDKQLRARAYATEKAKAREENEKSRADRERERRRKFGPPEGAAETGPDAEAGAAGR